MIEKVRTMAYDGDRDETIFQLTHDYDVNIEIVHEGPVDASGFPLVRISGSDENVKRIMEECWMEDDIDVDTTDV